MAQKKTKIHIDPRYDQTYNIYSDLAKEQIENIEGVASANDIDLASKGCLIITIDKRYDTDEVLAEIRQLGEII